VRQALDAPVTVRIDGKSLEGAILLLHNAGKIDLVLDGQAGQAAQPGRILPYIQPSPPVDVDFKDVKLKSALRTVLAPSGLTYVIVGDRVVVTTEDRAVALQMGQRVDVAFEGVEFAAALKQLGRETGARFVLDPRREKEAAAPVSLQLEDVPLETAVRLLSEMAGLRPVRVGNVLFVTDKKTAAELRADPDLFPPPAPQPPLSYDW
jgi:hypothetical protein